MKKIIFTTLIILLAGFNTVAQSSEKIYSVASSSVKIKMDENKKNGINPLSGITAQHVFKINKPDSIYIADLDVHIIEAPGMINYAMNLTRSWSRVKSVEFVCPASVTLDELNDYFSKINVSIVKDKVNYMVQ